MDLNSYLREAAGEGEHAGEGSFTLAGERALGKLAEFSLPSEYSWALKLVQYVVALSSAELRIAIGRKETCFKFVPGKHVSLVSIEEAFFQPELSENPALNHLKPALWSAGLEGRRAFRISMAGAPECLLWNGVRLSRVPEQNPPEQGMEVAVTPLGVGAVRAPWIGRQLLTSERNADLLKVLSRVAYPCPVPLRVDGRRLDGLERDPKRGWNSPSLPLCLLCSDENGEPRTAALVSLTFAARQQERKKRHSRLVWVEDGVVLEEEPLSIRKTFCSLTVFTSAKGLQKDLTTLNIAGSREKTERGVTALYRAIELLKGLADGKTGEMPDADTLFTTGRLYSTKDRLWGVIPRYPSYVHGGLDSWSADGQQNEITEYFKEFYAAIQEHVR